MGGCRGDRARWVTAHRYTRRTWVPASGRTCSSPTTTRHWSATMFLQVRDLRSGYRRVDVLQGIRFDLDRGRALAVLGRNGAGKTTLIMTMMGLVRPSAGSVLLDGRELAHRRPDQIARAGVALVPQGRRIWPRLTVDEHLTLVERQRPRGDGRRWTVDTVFDLLPLLAVRRRQVA